MRPSGLNSVTAISGVVQQHAGFTPAFLLGAIGMAAGSALLWACFLRRPGIEPNHG